MTTISRRKPTVAVWKFASCDGCQLTLLDCEDEFLSIVGAIDIAYFPEATRAEHPGPYDLSIVEGSITTQHDADRIHDIRARSTTLITIGACATAGGVQALKNWADVDEYISIVYANPGYIETLDTSTPISDHVQVDFELRGCPISKAQLVEVIDAFVQGRKPNTPSHTVCVDCKLRGTTCVMVSHGTPCMGPITHTGCGALCPAFNRGCYGCFGPSDSPNIEALRDAWHAIGVDDPTLVAALRTFNAYAPEFREASETYAR
ncbi:oxidoreductase [Actinomycetota bacterium]